MSWGPAAAWAGVLFFLSAIPGEDLPRTLFPGEDKVAHLGLYAVLGAALAWGRTRSRRGPAAPGGVSPSHALLLGAGFLYALADEGHQALVPGRHVSLADLGADAVGLLLGYWAWTRYEERRAGVPATSSTLRQPGPPGKRPE
jgi:VanZ family protein